MEPIKNDRIIFSVKGKEKEAIVDFIDESYIILNALHSLEDLSPGSKINIRFKDQKGIERNEQTELVEKIGNTLKLKRNPMERRRHFRIDDELPLIAREVDKDRPCKGEILTSSAIFSEAPPPDSTIHPKVWELLIEINRKLCMLLNKIELGDSNLLTSPPVKINLSAVGAKFSFDEEVSKGDIIELKMALPTCPTTVLLIYGKVVRVEKTPEDRYEIAVDFSEADETVREIMLQYTLEKHRKLIRQKRQL